MRELKKPEKKSGFDRVPICTSIYQLGTETDELWSPMSQARKLLGDLCSHTGMSEQQME